MTHHLKTKLEQSFQLTHDLVAHLEEESLSLDLPNLPSDQIAGQLWCVVGARESYIKALEVGGWQGFSCSLKTPRVKASVLEVLEATQQQLGEINFAGFTETQIDLPRKLEQALYGLNDFSSFQNSRATRVKNLNSLLLMLGEGSGMRVEQQPIFVFTKRKTKSNLNSFLRSRYHFSEHSFLTHQTPPRILEFRWSLF